MQAAMTGTPTITRAVEAPAPAAAHSTATVENRAEPTNTPRLPLTPEACLPETRIVGHVKFFDDQKGFGFIRRDNAEELYVHRTSIIGTEKHKTLTANQKVEFTPSKGPKGAFAKKVIPLTE
jgi:CspA family cold shock protein